MGTQTYFLGANSAGGFYSAYRHFCTPQEGNFLWVIKGGPGCGKSSFMRKIGKAAEDAGLDVEYVICSGDPDSLDGVFIPQKKLGYVDGTAPHTLDVPYPGAYGLYLNLGQFYDEAALRSRAGEILEVNKRYKSLYANAYAILSAVPQNGSPSPLPAQCKTRFYTAISCKGIVTVLPDIEKAKVSNTELNMLLKNAEAEDIVYLHPLWPDRAQGIYSAKNGMLYCNDVSVPACEYAVSYLKDAKNLHDELEQIYNPHVDFDGVYNLSARHIEKYL